MLVTGVICSGSFLSLNLLLAIIASIIAASAGNIINDYFDFEIDKINRPERVFPSNQLSLAEGLGLYVLFNFIALIIGYIIDSFAFSIIFFAIVLLFFYSFKLKRIPLFGNIVVSFLTGYTFLFAGFVSGNSKAAIIPSIFAFLINLIRELIKDIEDLKGDAECGLKTFPIVFGIRKSISLVLFYSVILIVSTLVPYIYQIYNAKYFAVVVIVNILLLYILAELYRKKERANFRKLSNLLKLNMVIGLLAIFIGQKTNMLFL